MIPSALFVLEVALRTKYSFVNKILRNLVSIPKMSTLVSLTSKQHTTGPVDKSVCGRIQKFVSVSAELNQNSSHYSGY